MMSLSMIIYLNLKIVPSKTDQYRQGNEVLISKGNTVACPDSNLYIMFHYLSYIWVPFFYFSDPIIGYSEIYF
jgi:hypothetical protein